MQLVVELLSNTKFEVFFYATTTLMVNDSLTLYQQNSAAVAPSLI